MEEIQSGVDREAWTALGLIKLPLLALIRRDEEVCSNDSRGAHFQFA